MSYTLSELTIHPDLYHLLWVYDDNYTVSNKTRLNLAMGVRLGKFGGVLEEPSAIHPELEVEFAPCEPARWFDSYFERTPAQRGSYIKYLANPYNPRAEHANVMLLLMGLERFLTTEKYTAAYHVLIRLKEAFKNKDVFNEICETIVNFAIYKKDETFLREIDFTKFHKSHQQYLLCAYLKGFPIPAEEAVKFANYAFPNYRYIEGEKRLFMNRLKENILHETGKQCLYINDFVVGTQRLKHVDFQVFHNYSLKFDYRIEYPDFTRAFSFTLALKYLLWKTHEDVKKYLADKRKKKPEPKWCPNPENAVLAEEALRDSKCDSK